MIALAFNASAQEQREEVNRLFLIAEDGEYGFIDRTGRVVVQPQYEFAGSYFPEALAAVKNVVGCVECRKYVWKPTQ